jgi:hypothetical protein
MYRSTNTYARRFVAPTLALLVFASSAWSQELPEAKTLSGWIESLKESPRGPFERIAWFCEDGSILPPRPYACRSHGGGIQHGMWNARVVALREGGYAVANVLAELEAQDFVGPEADLETLKQILPVRSSPGRTSVKMRMQYSIGESCCDAYSGSVGRIMPVASSELGLKLTGRPLLPTQKRRPQPLEPLC